VARNVNSFQFFKTRWTDKATRNVDDIVAKCQERTAAVCDTGVQTVKGMQ